jgi:hypothetical protein
MSIWGGASRRSEGAKVQIDLAYRKLRAVPEEVLKKYGTAGQPGGDRDRLCHLDLTGNEMRDLSSLAELTRLQTLILDDNKIDSHSKLPFLPELTTLSLNANKITNLSIFVDRLATAAPHLHTLSLLKNEACPNYFNGGTKRAYDDYRCYLLSRLPHLTNLDSQRVLDEERQRAQQLYQDITSLQMSRSLNALHRDELSQYHSATSAPTTATAAASASASSSTTTTARPSRSRRSSRHRGHPPSSEPVATSVTTSAVLVPSPPTPLASAPAPPSPRSANSTPSPPSPDSQTSHLSDSQTSHLSDSQTSHLPDLDAAPPVPPPEPSLSESILAVRLRPVTHAPPAPTAARPIAAQQLAILPSPTGSPLPAAAAPPPPPPPPLSQCHPEATTSESDPPVVDESDSWTSSGEEVEDFPSLPVMMVTKSRDPPVPRAMVLALQARPPSDDEPADDSDWD